MFGILSGTQVNLGTNLSFIKKKEKLTSCVDTDIRSWYIFFILCIETGTMRVRNKWCNYCYQVPKLQCSQIGPPGGLGVTLSNGNQRFGFAWTAPIYTFCWDIIITMIPTNFKSLLDWVRYTWLLKSPKLKCIVLYLKIFL